VRSLDVAKPFVTVRNRPQPSAGPYGRAYGKFVQTCFVTCGKAFLCGRRNTFATFSGDALHFSWQAQHFGDHHRHFAWQAQHLRRVVLRVFCESYCQGCVKWRQGADSGAGVAFCEIS